VAQPSLEETPITGWLAGLFVALGTQVALRLRRLRPPDRLTLDELKTKPAAA